MSDQTTESVLGRPATRADLDALPASVIGEVIDGRLYVSPRPQGRHNRVITLIVSDLVKPFDLGQGGPGGWWIQQEPGIVLPNTPEIVPDVAGWRRENLLDISETITIVPDWVCEVLSPGTRSYDVRTKRPYYARIGVKHMWLADPAAQTLVASENVDGKWTEQGIWSGDDLGRVPPFEDVEINFALWWRTASLH